MGGMAHYDIDSPGYDTRHAHEPVHGLTPVTTPPPLPHSARKVLQPLPMVYTAIGAAVLAIVAVYYYHHDPSDGGLPCTFKFLTGYDCPGCGSQRALHALLHGHLLQALRFNPLVFFAVPAAIMYIIVETNRRRMPRLHATITHQYVTTSILIVVVVFWILRNII